MQIGKLFSPHAFLCFLYHLFLLTALFLFTFELFFPLVEIFLKCMVICEVCTFQRVGSKEMNGKSLCRQAGGGGLGGRGVTVATGVCSLTGKPGASKPSGEGRAARFPLRCLQPRKQPVGSRIHSLILKDTFVQLLFSLRCLILWLNFSGELISIFARWGQSHSLVSWLDEGLNTGHAAFTAPVLGPTLLSHPQES